MNTYYNPNFKVIIQGLTLEADVTRAIMQLTYDNSLEDADMFTILLDNSRNRFTDSALFDVGKEVEIHMGYSNDLTPMMLGEITAVSPNFPQSGNPTLKISGYDKSHRLRHNKTERGTYHRMNDSAIAAIIAADNFLIPVVDPAPMPPAKAFFRTNSDWSILKELADRNFFEVFVRWNKLYFRFPRPSREMIVLEWGKTLSSFTPRLSTSGQTGIQIIRGYDYELAQKIIAILPTVSLGADIDNIIERVGSGFKDLIVGLGKNIIHDKPVNNFIDAGILGKSLLKQIIEGLYEGTGQCIGIPGLRAGEMVEIRGCGKQFSGTYKLSKATHTIDQSGYKTQFKITQKSNTSLLKSLRNKVFGKKDSFKQQKSPGVMTGKVIDNIDRDGFGRVRVNINCYGKKHMSAWARVAALKAGSNSGTYFLPDINDEVLIAFEQGNLNKPVVIGSLWNGKKRPPEINSPPGGNNKRVIKTKSGSTIVLDETKGNEKITIKDKSGNSISLNNKGGIEINAEKDLTIRSKGDITIEAKNVVINTDKDINMDAANVIVTVETAMDISKGGTGGKESEDEYRICIPPWCE